MKRYVFKDVRVGVYTGKTRSASSFTFFDDGYEGLPIKGGKDVGCEDTSLLDERGQGRPVEGMEQSMSNGFTKTPQVVQDDLGLWTEFILIRSMQMPAIEH